MKWLIVACLWWTTIALVHELKIDHDDRNLFRIETFGFNAGGQVNVSVHNFKLAEWKATSSRISNYRIALFLHKTTSIDELFFDFSTFRKSTVCILDHPKLQNDFVIDLSNHSNWKSVSFGHHIRPKEAGLYTLVFVRCIPSDGAFVDVDLHVRFMNRGPNYLSAGDAPLPVVYLVSCALFAFASVLWLLTLYRAQQTQGRVLSIHYLMAVLLGFKVLSLLFESIRFHYIAMVGSSELWSIVYYVFVSIKGMLLFLVLMLIGSGWTIMKHCLDERQQRVIVVVLSFQAANNIALIVLEESALGTKSWGFWSNALRIADLLCCGIVLLPIKWSMDHLASALAVDGKAQEIMNKLTRFRSLCKFR